MGEYSPLIEDTKLDMKDLEPEEETIGYNAVELKYDGFFVYLRNRGGFLQYITSGGDVRRTIAVGTQVPDFNALGEWIYGTNWAKKDVNSEIFNTVKIHTLLSIEKQDFKRSTMSERHTYLQNEILSNLWKSCHTEFQEVTTYPFSDWKFLWDIEVKQKGYEGLVFKNSLLPFGSYKQSRMKNVVAQDYVIVGFEEGKGRLSGTLGALEVALYKDSKLMRIGTVGGGMDDETRDLIWADPSKYFMTVVEVHGKTRFPSGALRHPSVFQFRSGKPKEDCKWQE